MKPKNLKFDLLNFHKRRGATILNKKSPINGDQFPGEFNVSGFHIEVQELSHNVKSFWGIDSCMRIKDNVDDHHSFIFDMGIFAKSVNMNGDFREPSKDKRFLRFQEDIITQFMQLIKFLNLDPHKIEATYLGRIKFGNSNGRDRSIEKQYIFPDDKNSKSILEEYGVRTYKVQSLANLDIHPVESALVGPRIEVAYNGIEIATIVFDCFKIEKGRLIPINYVGGYAIGIERVMSILEEKKPFINSIPKYSEAFKELIKTIPAAECSLLQRDAEMVIFGTEVIARLNSIDLSKKQKELVRQLKSRLKEAMLNLNLNRSDLKKISSIFENENTNNWS